MIIVSNASPLIALSKIKKFHLLRELFHEIHISEGVLREVVFQDRGRPGEKEVKKALSHWLYVIPVKDRHAVNRLLQELNTGEAEAIVLAKEMKADLLLMDDDKGRTKAKSCNLKVLGTLGVLVMGYESGLLKNLEHALDDLRRKGFWIKDEILRAVWEKCLK